MTEEKKSYFEKLRELPFDKKIELGFAFALVLFTIITTCTLKDQLTIMRDQMHSSTRAWLCAAGISAKSGFKVGESPTVVLDFNNSGNSPARDVTIKYNMTLMKPPIPSEVPLGKYISQEPSRGIIAPDSKFSSLTYTKREIIFNQESIDKVSRNELRLYIHGFIDYLDVFDERHCTNFCLVSHVGDSKNVSFQVCANNNNMTDEECKYK